MFAAFRRPSPAADEVRAWEDAYAFDERVTIAGLREPLRYDTATGVALCVTGIGQVDAATTVSSLLSAPAFDFSETYFLTVGVAGTSPARGTVGAVFVADALVDWDQKYRLDHDGETALSPFPFKSAGDLCKRLNPDLVALAATTAADVTLTDSTAAAMLRASHGTAPARRDPFVGVGTSLTGSEFWHGATAADWAESVCAYLDVGPYCTTEMEGFATAAVLERFGHLDRYLSIRAASNFDRPGRGVDAAASIVTDEIGLAVAADNAFRVADAVVARLLGRPDPTAQPSTSMTTAD